MHFQHQSLNITCTLRGICLISVFLSTHSIFLKNLNMTLCCGTWALSPGHHLTRLPNAILTFHCVKGAKMLWMESQLPYALKNKNILFWVVIPENRSIEYVFTRRNSVQLYYFVTKPRHTECCNCCRSPFISQRQCFSLTQNICE